MSGFSEQLLTSRSLPPHNLWWQPSEREQIYVSQQRQRRGGQVPDCSLLRDTAVVAQLLTTSWFDSGSLNSCISICTTLWDQHQGGVCRCGGACASKGTKMAFHMSIYLPFCLWIQQLARSHLLLLMDIMIFSCIAAFYQQGYFSLSHFAKWGLDITENYHSCFKLITVSCLVLCFAMSVHRL